MSSSKQPPTNIPIQHNNQLNEFYPKPTDRNGTVAYLDGCLKTSDAVLALSHAERRKILRRYFPQHVVEAYTPCSPETGEEGTGAERLPVIPHNELIEALQQSPLLVMEETPIDRYITALCGSSNSNDVNIIHEAARKLAIHWKVRKYFFQDRAFLPMVQSSEETGLEGALSAEDMEWLNKGYAVLLPPATDPTKKRSVLITNPQNLPSYHYSGTHYANIKIRISFYFLHLISINPVTQKEGALLINFLLHRPCQYYSQWCCYMVGEVFPIKDFDAHFLLLPSSIIRSQSFMSFAISVSRYIIAIFSSFLVGTKFHFGYSDNCALRKLAQSTGLDVSDISSWIGGTDKWSSEKFQMWRNGQMQMEWEKDIEARKSNVTTRRRPPADKERARRLDAERCRKKRLRAKQQLENLEKEVQDLKDRNEALKNDNTRLEKLLLYAEHEAHVIDGLDHDKHHCSEMHSFHDVFN